MSSREKEGRVRLWIFDADGTLRRTTVPGQVSPRAPSEWELLPGVRRALHVLASDSTASFAVASNQDHVGYGHLSHEMAHRLLCDALEAATGRHVDARAVRLCPHRLEDPCGCRKPAPGLLLDLLEYFSVAPHEAVFVGDQPTDASAAEQAGIRFRWAHEVFGA